MLWFSNITLITTIYAVYLGTRQEGFTGISSGFDEEFTEINQSLAQGRVPPPCPRQWPTKLKCRGFMFCFRFIGNAPIPGPAGPGFDSLDSGPQWPHICDGMFRGEPPGDTLQGKTPPPPAKEMLVVNEETWLQAHSAVYFFQWWSITVSVVNRILN